MARRNEIAAVYGAGLIQGVALVTFPAASAIFTGASQYDLSSTQYGGMFIPQAIAAIGLSLLGAGMTRRLGPKRIYLLGLAANLLAMALLVASRFILHEHALAYAVLLVATGCLGAGFGLTVPTLNTFAAAFFPRSTDKAVRQFLAAGVPSQKLLIGAAFYGRAFADVQPAHDGLYQAYGHYQGEYPWPQLKAGFINRGGYIRYWDEVAQAPFLWNAATHCFISYDDPQSIAAKATYVKSHHLGGIMYWEQSEDPQGELLDAVWRGLQPGRPE